MKWEDIEKQYPETSVYTNRKVTDVDCPKCGKKLYKRTDIVLLRYPLKCQYECECGFVGYAFVYGHFVIPNEDVPENYEWTLEDAVHNSRINKKPEDSLISRSALLEAYDNAHQGPPGGARKLIENAPEAVIRCKYCKWYSEETSWCNNSNTPKEPTFFCKDGRSSNE